MNFQEEEILESKQTEQELVDRCKALEFELDMCKRRVYIPKRNDQLDEELAKFLNTYDKRKKLKVMFLREAEGVYLFGQRRVIL